MKQIFILPFIIMSYLGAGQTTYQFSYFLTNTGIDIVNQPVTVYSSSMNLTICGAEENCLELVIKKVTPRGVETSNGVIQQIHCESIKGIQYTDENGKILVLLREKPDILHIEFL